MPNNEEHAQHCYNRYGIHARDLHHWMDEPSLMYGVNHRRFRHNPDYPPKWAVEKYGYETAQNVMLDHIYLDRKRTRQGAVRFDLVHIVDAFTPKGVKVGIVIPDFDEFDDFNQKLLAFKARSSESEFNDLMLELATANNWRLEIPNEDGDYCGILYNEPFDWRGLELVPVWIGWICLLPYFGEMTALWVQVWIVITVATILRIVTCLGKGRSKVKQKMEHKHEEDTTDELEELILIEDLAEELEHQGYFARYS